MAPRAGVEPATYRLGGELSNCFQAPDCTIVSDQVRPILHAMQHVYKSLISLGVDFRFGRLSDKAS